MSDVKESAEQPGTEAGDPMWPMGAVTRRTGIGEHTLRAWERRFGFPVPHRLPSGHRRYPVEQVQQLLLIGEALQCGYRAGDVVPLPLEGLEQLLRDSGRAEGLIREPSPEWLGQILDAAVRFDRHELASQLRYASSTLGIGRFLRERVAPILTEVGEAWSRGDLEIRHEHFISEVLEDELRALRSPLESAGTGRPVVLANLPNEFHELGLQIAAVEVAAAGRALRILGRNTPVEDIVETARAIDAAAVGLSISAFAVNQATAAAVETLRRLLPARIQLWLGGGGADKLTDVPNGVQVLASLDDFERAIRTLKA